MRRTLLLLALAIMLGSAAFVAGSRIQRPDCGARPPCESTMDWLKREFALDDHTFARVQTLHDSYKPACEDLCRRVAANRRRIGELAKEETGYSSGLDAALREAADLRFESQRLYLRHVQAVAAAMPPEQGRRYTAMMRARVFSPCECKGGMCVH